MGIEDPWQFASNFVSSLGFLGWGKFISNLKCIDVRSSNVNKYLKVNMTKPTKFPFSISRNFDSFTCQQKANSII